MTLSGFYTPKAVPYHEPTSIGTACRRYMIGHITEGAGGQVHSTRDRCDEVRNQHPGGFGNVFLAHLPTIDRVIGAWC